MRIRTHHRSMLFVAAVVLAGAAPLNANATEQIQPPTAVLTSQDAEAAHQVEADRVRLDWRLDPAIFTEISPVNAPEIAIKLPEDQREEQ